MLPNCHFPLTPDFLSESTLEYPFETQWMSDLGITPADRQCPPRCHGRRLPECGLTHLTSCWIQASRLPNNLVEAAERVGAVDPGCDGRKAKLDQRQSVAGVGVGHEAARSPDTWRPSQAARASRAVAGGDDHDISGLERVHGPELASIPVFA